MKRHIRIKERVRSDVYSWRYACLCEICMVLSMFHHFAKSEIETSEECGRERSIRQFKLTVGINHDMHWNHLDITFTQFKHNLHDLLTTQLIWLSLPPSFMLIHALMMRFGRMRISRDLDMNYLRCSSFSVSTMHALTGYEQLWK